MWNKRTTRLNKTGFIILEVEFFMLVYGEFGASRIGDYFDEKEQTVSQVFASIQHLFWNWGMAESSGREVKLEDVVFGWCKLIRV